MMDYELIANFVEIVLGDKDPYNHHGSKVEMLCTKMAPLMELPLTSHETEMLRYGARLHDVGKLFLDDAVLNAHGRLTTSQYEAVKTHAIQGFRLALKLGFDPIICSIIHFHHENFDGSGYPRGLKGDEIPVFARMVRVADTFDALTSRRAYRKESKAADALMVIEAESERCFDPAMVELLKRVVNV